MNMKLLRIYYRAFYSLLVLIYVSGCGSPNPLINPASEIFKTADPQPLRVGVAMEKINPLGPAFLAGGFPFRLGIHVHDDLWARAVVFDDGTHRVALVSVDLIGINYDDVLLIRSEIESTTKVDYVLVAATHSHSAPDVVGFWAPVPLKIDDLYRASMRAQVARAIRNACDNLRPATIKIASAPAGDPPLLRDTRLPNYIDDTLTVWQAVDSNTNETIVTSVHFATHPILVSSYLDVSSDFCHYLRQAVEAGMEGDDGPVAAQGGMCVFFNADMAGRLVGDNIQPLTTVPLEPVNYRTAQAYGYRLAHRALSIFSQNAKTISEPMGIRVAFQQIQITPENDLLRFAVQTRIISRSLADGDITSEVGVVRIGPMEFFAIPGMIFPELTRSALPLQAIPGSDFPDAPAEAPRLDQMADQPYFIPVGLANDMLGYLIPKCLFDAQPPFSDDPAPYGEVVCPGPDAAGIVINAFNTLQTAIH